MTTHNDLSYTVQRYTAASAFYRDVLPTLSRAEAVNNLPIGLSTNLAAQATLDPAVYLARVVNAAGEVCAIALRTPPHKLVLATVDHPQQAEAFAALAEDVYDFYGDTLPAVLGRPQETAVFQALWTQLTGKTARAGLDQRIYELEQVIAPQGIAGQLRDATAADYDLILAWLKGFHDDAFGGEYDLASLERNLSQRLHQGIGGYTLWEVNGKPVAMAGFGGKTPNGIRIGPVYTPPHARKNGYGSAMTAALSQKLLDSGRRFCFLYTDLSNPTSNHIYQTIGYTPVCDVDEYWFD